MRRAEWREHPAVNLVGFRSVPVFDGGYSLFDRPRGEGVHMGVVLANRERLLSEYRASHPLPWQKALASVLAEIDGGR